MNINNATAGAGPLANNLTARGISPTKAEAVETGLKSVLADAKANSTAGNGKTLDVEGIRKALDAKINEDVAKGVLTQEDAAAIGSALDEMEAKFAAGGKPPAGGASQSGQSGDSGSGSGSEEKTELSRVVTISDNTMTTTITYTDGTSESETSVPTSADVNEYGDKAAQEAAAKEAAARPDPRAILDSWLAKLEPGTLLDRKA